MPHKISQMWKNAPGTRVCLLSYFHTISKSLEKRAQGLNLFWRTWAIYFWDKFAVQAHIVLESVLLLYINTWVRSPYNCTLNSASLASITIPQNRFTVSINSPSPSSLPIHSQPFRPITEIDLSYTYTDRQNFQ